MNIENEYNKRFNNQQLPNENFDTDGLWVVISEDLDKEQPESRSLVMRKRWLLALLFISIFGGAFGIFDLGNGNEKVSESMKSENAIINDVLTDSHKTELDPSSEKHDSQSDFQHNGTGDITSSKLI